MIKIGKIYEFHFGKDIFTKYIVIDINFDFIQLRRIEDDYAGAPLDIRVAPETLIKKRKIRDWSEVRL